MRKLCLTAMLLALAAAAGGAEAGQETLTNEDIISMFKAQLDKELVVSKIKNSNNIFDVSAKAMINLKEQGVPDDVIAIMIDQVHDQRKILSKKVSLAIQHLTSERPETRTTALLYLQRLGGIAYPYLREALGSSRAPIRAVSTKALARLGDQGSIALIRILLVDTVLEVRYAAAESLARLKDKDSIQMAKKAVVNGAAPLDAYIRLLGCHRDKQSVGFIRIRLLKDSDWRTRAQAAWALGEIRSPQGREALEHSLLQDGTKEVRREAAVALGKLGIPQSADALMHVCKVDSYARREALLALGNFPPKIAVPFLIKDALAKNKNQLAPPEVAAILQSLRQLTNQDYGPDVDRWLLWWEKNKDRLEKLDGPIRDAVAPEETQGSNYIPPPPVLRKEPWEEEDQATSGVQPQLVAAEIKSPASAQAVAVALEPDPEKVSTAVPPEKAPPPNKNEAKALRIGEPPGRALTAPPMRGKAESPGKRPVDEPPPDSPRASSKERSWHKIPEDVEELLAEGEGTPSRTPGKEPARTAPSLPEASSPPPAGKQRAAAELLVNGGGRDTPALTFVNNEDIEASIPGLIDLIGSMAGRKKRKPAVAPPPPPDADAQPRKKKEKKILVASSAPAVSRAPKQESRPVKVVAAANKSGPKKRKRWSLFRRRRREKPGARKDGKTAVAVAKKPASRVSEPAAAAVQPPPIKSPAVAKKPILKKPIAKKPIVENPIVKKPVAKKPVAVKPAAIKESPAQTGRKPAPGKTATRPRGKPTPRRLWGAATPRKRKPRFTTDDYYME